MNQRITDFSQLPSVKLYFSIGETILTEGDRTDGWFVLISGKVGVFKRDFSVAEISKPGTVIGELGFLLNIHRTATLIAQEPTMLLHVRVGLDELFTKYPDLAKKMVLMLAERLVKTTEDWRESVDRVDAY
ncbi:MAG TPA: cyclic nucleotide-binding domain-containing protein [Bacteroidota bacterium]|nr:cyclic nucleotide-binding domain-containing protein [Bacteroidota bacterium]